MGLITHLAKGLSCLSTQRRQQAPVASLRLSPGWSHLSSGSRRCTSPARSPFARAAAHGSAWFWVVSCRGSACSSWACCRAKARAERRPPGDSRRRQRSRPGRLSGRLHRCRRPHLPQKRPRRPPRRHNPHRLSQQRPSQLHRLRHFESCRRRLQMLFHRTSVRLRSDPTEQAMSEQLVRRQVGGRPRASRMPRNACAHRVIGALG